MMDSALAQCIVESLRITGSCEASLARLRTFSRRDWLRTLSWLDDSGLALYLLERVNRLDASDVLPREVKGHLERGLASNRQRLLEMRGEFAALNGRFEAAGVEYVVLKGFALIPAFCPDAGLRTQYDYDYLVALSSLDAARQAIQEAGYSQKTKSPGFGKKGECFFSARALAIPPPDTNFYSAEVPRDVELHLSLWESLGEMVNLGVPADTLDRKRQANWQNVCFPALADDDALLFQSLHAFQHFLNYWCKPSCLLEVTYFIARRHGDAVFWEQFRQRAESHRYLPQIVSLIFSLADLLFHPPIPPEVSDWISRRLPAALHLWVQRHGKRWALAPFPGSKLSLLAHREFIEDPTVWSKVKWSRLIPFHRPAQVVESDNPSLSSRLLANRDQWRFVWSRAAFHVGAFVRYTGELPRWKRALRRFSQGSS